jgi:hypothetical protein
MLTGTRHDYSVCTTWHIATHVYRDRLEYPDLRRKVIGMATGYGT